MVRLDGIRCAFAVVAGIAALAVVLSAHRLADGTAWWAPVATTAAVAAPPLTTADATLGATQQPAVEVRRLDYSAQAAARHAPAVTVGRMAIAMISYGWTAAGYEDHETIKGSRQSLPIALKGILRHARACTAIHFYFLTGPEDEQRIRSFFAPLTSARMPVSYQFVPLNSTQLRLWMDAIGHRPTHRTGEAGNVKFFYPMIFPSEERMLMLDSDVMVGHDVCELWRLFESFTPEQLFAFAPQWPKIDAHKDNQFNAGVGLLHLARMRKADWLELSRQSIALWAAERRHPPCCAHGDQSAFHMVRHLRPSALGYLPRWWNINKCHQYQHIDRRPSGSFVGIVHLGCCKMCTRAKIGSRWAAMFDSLDQLHVGPNLSVGTALVSEQRGAASSD